MERDIQMESKHLFAMHARFLLSSKLNNDVYHTSSMYGCVCMFNAYLLSVSSFSILEAGIGNTDLIFSERKECQWNIRLICTLVLRQEALVLKDTIIAFQWRSIYHAQILDIYISTVIAHSCHMGLQMDTHGLDSYTGKRILLGHWSYLEGKLKHFEAHRFISSGSNLLPHSTVHKYLLRSLCACALKAKDQSIYLTYNAEILSCIGPLWKKEQRSEQNWKKGGDIFICFLAHGFVMLTLKEAKTGRVAKCGNR